MVILDWFFWEEKVHRDEENGKGNCFEFAFISGRYMSSENAFATFFLLSAPFSSKAGVRPGKKGFPPRKRSGRENGPRDLSAAAVGAAPHPDACVKHN